MAGRATILAALCVAVAVVLATVDGAPARRAAAEHQRSARGAAKIDVCQLEAKVPKLISIALQAYSNNPDIFGIPTCVYPDADGDGVGAETEFDVCELTCVPIPGTSETTGDCDDSDAAVNPSAAEVCDGKDNDCDGDVDEGADICGAGKACNAGVCVDTDPCAGISCAPGSVCNAGVCVATNPCAGVTCPSSPPTSCVASGPFAGQCALTCDDGEVLEGADFEIWCDGTEDCGDGSDEMSCS